MKSYICLRCFNDDGKVVEFRIGDKVKTKIHGQIGTIVNFDHVKGVNWIRVLPDESTKESFWSLIDNIELYS